MLSEQGLRERKKEQTRRALVAAATEQFSERGYGATTVEDIAAAAAVSPRTFFRYFPAKEDVVFVDFDRAYEHWEEAFAAGPVGEPLLDALRRATLAVNADYEARRDEFDLLHRLMAEEPSLALRAMAFDQSAIDRAAHRIAAALGTDADADLRPRIVAGAAMAAVRVATTAWAAGGRVGERSAAVEAAYDALSDLGAILALPRHEPVAPTA
jgi:AcrR family transcriptional regulator